MRPRVVKALTMGIAKSLVRNQASQSLLGHGLSLEGKNKADFQGDIIWMRYFGKERILNLAR